MSKLVYTTTNPGKFQEVSKYFSAHNLTLHSPSEFGVDIDVVESGKTLEENSILKLEGYRKHLPPESILISDDTGVEIDALDGEPGIHTRRWVGHRMSDQEIIDYCIERLQGVPMQDRGAQFRTVLAVSKGSNEPRLFSGIMRGHIVMEPIKLEIEGFPFESLLYVDEYQLMLGDIHRLSIEEKIKKNILTHRERAVVASLDYLHQLLAQ